MSLSKIYRGAEAEALQEFRFRSFGEVDSMAPLESGAGGSASVGQSEPPVAPAADAGPQIQEAYARGRQEGQALAEQRLESVTQALTQALEESCRLRESLAQTSTRDMLRLVMAVSEQVIRKTVEIDPQVVLGIIESALQASVRADSFRIRVCPEDLELVTQQKPLFLASLSGLKNLSVETDPGITPGGCRVDSELGDVDATIETQLDAIRQALGEAIAAG